MEKFSGNGAECYQKYHENGNKGTILRTDHAEIIVLVPTWLSAPCTYTPPEPKWVDCTAGEALDSLMTGKNIQLCLMGENAWVDVPAGWTGWTTKCRKYRKEA